MAKRSRRATKNKCRRNESVFVQCTDTQMFGRRYITFFIKQRNGENLVRKFFKSGYRWVEKRFRVVPKQFAKRSRFMLFTSTKTDKHPRAMFRNVSFKTTYFPYNQTEKKVERVEHTPERMREIIKKYGKAIQI